MKNNIAFVLGNGTSRQAISLYKLKKHGIIYGCNALYRTFTPDVLVAVDPKMIYEINLAKYKGTTYFENPKGWSSGPTAVWLASLMYKNIFMLGFDFIGIHGKINNIYAGTQNYLDKDSVQTHYGNWENQIAEVIAMFPETTYVRVKGNDFTPEKLSIYSNYKEEDINTFVERTLHGPA